jgi:hypothetical protein
VPNKNEGFGRSGPDILQMTEFFKVSSALLSEHWVEIVVIRIENINPVTEIITIDVFIRV